VVTRDVPAFALVGGNPARVIRDRRQARAGADRDADRNAARDSLMRLAGRAEADWMRVLERHRSAQRPGYLYSDPRNDADDPVRPDCDAIQIAAMFGAVAGGRDREGWAGALAARQDPATGRFLRDPGGAGGVPHAYDTLCVTYALECLGRHPSHRMVWADRVLEDPGAFLDALPWARQGWHSGAEVDALGTAAYVNARYFGGQPGLPGLLGELLLRNHAASGMWSPPAGEDWLQPVNGFYRLSRGVHAQFGQPLPRPEQAIDTVLAHAARNGWFVAEGRTACNVLDVLHPLMLAGAQSSHRRAEADAGIARMLLGIDAAWQPGLGIAFAPGEAPGLQGTEMWLSIAALAARHFGWSGALGFELAGIHRWEPACPDPATGRTAAVPA